MHSCNFDGADLYILKAYLIFKSYGCNLQQVTTTKKGLQVCQKHA